ncbi:transcription termination factor 2 [Drosophila willistoni]|nr:transcription termination factor 2 [Drosophila willistoni]
MSDSEEYYSEEEDVVISASTSGRSSRSSRYGGAVAGKSSHGRYSNVTVEDTESDEDVVQPGRRLQQKGKQRQVIESTSEDEEEDARAFSPRTRMSITGVRPKDLDDDSSEIEYSGADGEEEQPDEPEADEEQEDAAAARYRQATDGAANLLPRYTTQFVNQMESNNLHSTLFGDALEVEVEESSSQNNSAGSDVMIVSNRQPLIEISSTEDDDSIGKENRSGPPFASRSTRHHSPRSSAGAAVVKAAKNLVQPTIQMALKQRTSPVPSAPRRSRIKSEDQLVAKPIYQDEMRKLNELKVQLNDAVKLYQNVSHKLPDKGYQMRNRISSLRENIAKQEKFVEGLNVEKVTPKKVTKPTVVAPVRKSNQNEAPDWDELSAAVNQIQPKYTGAQGLATFNTQKALTVDALKDLHGSLKGCPAENVMADDPQGLKVQLMGHQKHALAWLSWRESQSPRGGILADDMGLGKTLTMISSVLACKNRQDARGDAGSESESDDDTGSKRKSTGGWNSKGRKDYHKGGTLVVCPASLLRQWEGEVESKVSRNRLTVCVHHGNNRETKSKHLRTYDLVVTTYQIVAREQKASGALFGMKWRRIILDEAHVVRNHKAQTSIAVSALRAKYRWALTGTPIQNKELDVYALLKFLRCSPFDDLATWKKWIDNKSAGGQNRLNLLMKSLMLRRTKAQLQLDGKLNNLPQKELRLIEINLDKDEMNVYQKVLTYSRTLFAQFLFQRSEKDSDMNFISDANKPTYNQIKDPNGAYYKMHQKFAKMAGSKKEVKSHDILVLLLRLRQICCHPGLIDSMLEDNGADKMANNSSEEDSPEIDLLAQLNKLAITDTSNSSNRSGRGSRGSRSSRGGADDEHDDDGPPLRGDEARIAKASSNVLKRSNPVFNLKRPSSKMLKIIEILKTSIFRGKSNDKAIIVSQWTGVLDILRDHLEKDKFDTLSLNGTIPVKSRQDIVNQFNDPRNPKRILLLSLTAGGVGLNLIGANHLLLLDLHWNPQLECQAQDRIYRVGQKKDVVIYKFMCLETVEERIKALQDRKLELAEGVLTGAKVSTKLTIDDLKGLFGM